MNLERLKQLAKRVGGVIIVNGENPEFVILTYNKYRDLLPEETSNGTHAEDALFFGNYEHKPGINGLDRDREEIEMLNREILALKEEIRQRESAELASVESEEPGTPEGVDS